MTQVSTNEVPTGRSAASQLTERLVAHVEQQVKGRLGLQASLEGCAPAAVLNRILDAGLMTYDQIADATRERGQQGSNGNGTH
jgi:hypothetical protein